MDQARKKMHESNEEFERARLAALKAKQAFDDVKKRRLDRFAACFQHVSGEIDAIYKVRGPIIDVDCQSFSTLHVCRV